MKKIIYVLLILAGSQSFAYENVRGYVHPSNGTYTQPYIRSSPPIMMPTTNIVPVNPYQFR